MNLPRNVLPAVIASFAAALRPGGQLIFATHVGAGDVERAEAYSGCRSSSDLPMAAGTTHRPRAAGRNATRHRPALPRRSDQRTCRRPCCTTRQAMGGPAQFARTVAELHRSRSLAPAGSSVASRRADTTDVDGLSSSRPTPLMAPDGPARRRRPGVICELRTARPCSGGFAIIHVRSAKPVAAERFGLQGELGRLPATCYPTKCQSANSHGAPAFRRSPTRHLWSSSGVPHAVLAEPHAAIPHDGMRPADR